MRSSSLLVLLAVGLTACGAGSDDSAVTITEPVVQVPETTTSTGPIATTTTAAPTTTAPPETTTTTVVADGIAVSVSAGEVEVTGATSVAVGDEVVIRVSSDVADQVHVHGYDLMADVAPDSPAEITFAADVPGIFEVELEDSGLPLLQLEVGA